MFDAILSSLLCLHSFPASPVLGQKESPGDEDNKRPTDRPTDRRTAYSNRERILCSTWNAVPAAEIGQTVFVVRPFVRSSVRPYDQPTDRVVRGRSVGWLADWLTASSLSSFDAVFRHSGFDCRSVWCVVSRSPVLCSAQTIFRTMAKRR